MFLGGGFGAGKAESDRIASGEFSYDRRLVFVDGENLIVRVVGQNSDFIFYVKEGEKQVSVSPVRGTIQRIEFLADSVATQGNPAPENKSDESSTANVTDSVPPQQ